MTLLGFVPPTPFAPPPLPGTPTPTPVPDGLAPWMAPFFKPPSDPIGDFLGWLWGSLNSQPRPGPMPADGLNAGGEQPPDGNLERYLMRITVGGGSFTFAPDCERTSDSAPSEPYESEDFGDWGYVYGKWRIDWATMEPGEPSCAKAKKDVSIYRRSSPNGTVFEKRIAESNQYGFKVLPSFFKVEIKFPEDPDVIPEIEPIAEPIPPPLPQILPIEEPLPEAVPDLDPPKPVIEPIVIPGGVPVPAPSPPAPEPEPEPLPARRPLRPITPTPPTPDAPALPDTTQTHNGAIVPKTPELPATTPKDQHTIGGDKPVLNTGPAPTLEGIAKEVGRIEQKLNDMWKPEPGNDLDWGALFQLLKLLYDLFFNNVPGSTYTLNSVCEVGPDGQPTSESVEEVIGSMRPTDATIARLDALIPLLQGLKDFKQPTCGRVRPTLDGEWVSIEFASKNPKDDGVVLIPSGSAIAPRVGVTFHS